MAHVYDYKDYTVKLKEWFDMTKESISDEDIQEFINYYNLFKDYKIIINDVRKDLNRNKLKHIRSYKEYLIKLKNEFGMISYVPDEQDIQKFIQKYYLDKDWGISSYLVKIDISNIFINLQNNKGASILKQLDERKRLGIDLVSKHKKDIANINTDIKHKSETSILKQLDERKKLGIDLVSLRKKDLANLYPSNSFVYKSETSILKQLEERKKRGINLVSKHKEDLINNKVHRLNYNFETIKNVNFQNSFLETLKKPVLISSNNPILISRKKTYLIDGDNHIDEGMKGIERQKKTVDIIAFFCVEGAKIKFDRKYKERPNVKTFLVPKGEQAVDNRIKAYAGRLLSKGNQDITIVSQDKGYNKYINKNNGKKNNLIKLAKCVE